MGRRAADPAYYIDKMCDEFARSSTRSERGVRFYREQLRPVVKALERLGCHTYPQDIEAADVKALLDDYAARGLTISTRRAYICALRVWTDYYGNDCVRRMGIRWPADMRPNVRWLTQDQAISLLEIPKSPAQELVIHCELCLGMRRVEVLRLTTASFTGTYVLILGKGPQGGKPRMMPYHRDTARVLARYMEWRDMIIGEVRAKRPTAPVPDDLLIWRQGRELKPYAAKGSGIDRMLNRLQDDVGFTFSNHDLRRTFGRTMYRSGVKVATISKMMGHESEEQTLRYIGVDLDDMTDAMKQFML